MIMGKCILKLVKVITVQSIQFIEKIMNILLLDL